MCIDAPESTTNSLSSGLIADGAGKHQFSEGEKNVVLFFPLISGNILSFSMRLHVRGLYIAMVHYSSLCVSAVVLTLGGDDIVEVVQDREQVDSEREKGRGAREDKTRTNNARSNM